MDSNLVDVVF